MDKINKDLENERKIKKNRGQNKTSYLKKNYIPFGRLILNKKFLNENKLLVKHPNTHAPVPKIRQTKISDNLKAYLLELIDTGKINFELQKELQNDEQKILETLFYVSKIGDHIGGFRYVSKELNDYIHRFNILKGSLLAGNSNDEIKNEMVNIIHLLNNPVINKINDEDKQFLIEILKEF